MNLMSARDEVKMNRTFFDPKGVIKEAWTNKPGTKYLCRMLDIVEDPKDVWLIFEIC